MTVDLTKLVEDENRPSHDHPALLCPTRIMTLDEQMFHAVLHSPPELVEWLCDHVDLDQCDAEGFTPLLHAVRTNRQDIVEILLDNHADVDATFPGTGTTLLQEAVAQSNLETVGLLLSYNADVDQVDDHQRTPLIVAVLNRDLQMASLLIDHQAMIDEEDDAGLSALYHAVLLNDPEMVDLLLNNNADADVTDAQGRDFVHCALDYPDCLAVFSSELLEATDDQGNTLVHLAVLENLPLQTLTLLLDRIYQCPNHLGQTPLWLAVHHRRPIDVVQALLSDDKDDPQIDQADEEHGRTSLHEAINNANATVVQLLIDLNADITATALDHKTPLELCLELPSSEARSVIERALRAAAAIAEQATVDRAKVSHQGLDPIVWTARAISVPATTTFSMAKPPSSSLDDEIAPQARRTWWQRLWNLPASPR